MDQGLDKGNEEEKKVSELEKELRKSLWEEDHVVDLWSSSVSRIPAGHLGHEEEQTSGGKSK